MMRKGYSTYELVTGRMAIGYFLNSIYCKVQGISVYPANNFQAKLMVARGLIGSAGMILMF